MRPANAIWVVLPTYDERENLGSIVPAILAELPEATLLVVDDASPDGTGELADAMAAADPRVRVLHRAGKEGLARAYADGFAAALAGGAGVVVQMDADWSHHPRYLRSLVEAIGGGADLVLGSRYVRGGGTRNWPLRRRLVSRGGNLYAQLVLWLSYRDLTGGFKAWRAGLLRQVEPSSVRISGYVFQVELTHRAHLAGARIRELPILFEERRAGVSKMSGGIFVEAARQVLRLRLRTFRWKRRVRLRVD